MKPSTKSSHGRNKSKSLIIHQSTKYLERENANLRSQFRKASHNPIDNDDGDDDDHRIRNQLRSKP